MTVGGIIANNGTSVSTLTKTGAGTLVLGNAANSFGGGMVLNQGTVFVSNTGNLGAASGSILFNGGATLQFGGNSNVTISSHSPIVANSAAVTFDNNSTGATGVISLGADGVPGIVSGTGGFTYLSSVGNTSASVRIRFNAFPFFLNATVTNSTYAGPTTIYAGNVQLTYDTVNGVPYTSKLNPSSVLNLGGTLLGNVTAGPGDSNPIDTLATNANLIADTSSHIGFVPGLAAAGAFYLNSSATNGIIRNSGSTLEVDGSGSNFLIANGALANTSGIIGGWATAGNVTTVNSTTVYLTGTDWAALNATSAIGVLPAGGYTNDTWAGGNNTTVTTSSAPAAASTTNSLRFVSLGTANGGSLNQTLTLSGQNVIQSGGILVTTNTTGENGLVANIPTPGTDVSTFTIAAGSLTSGNGTDLIVNQFNLLAGSSLTIASQIVNNGATPIGLTLGGNTLGAGGTLILTNSSNSYSGATVVNAATILRAGAANVVPQNSAVILSMLGTFDMNGFNQSVGSLANFNNSLATMNGLNYGYGTTVAAGTTAAVAGGTYILTIGNDNTATNFNGALRDNPLNANARLALAKVGAGTQFLGNFNDNIVGGTPNLSNYSGGTTITGGTLDILQDADLGAVPSVPITNITFNGNGTLRFNSAYLGTTLSTNRSIVVTSGQSGTLDTNGNNITYAGLVTSSGTFDKAGAGILEMDGAPTLNANSGLSVTGGTLRLKYR